MEINLDVFATGFEEHISTCTFSQEKRALNPVRIVEMEVLVYDMCGRGRVCSHMQELSETLSV